MSERHPKLSQAQLRALRLMASRPDGCIDMRYGFQEAATNTVASLDNIVLAEWCKIDDFGATAARITDAGRRALQDKEG